MVSIQWRLPAAWCIEFAQVLNWIYYALGRIISIIEDAISVIRRLASDTHDLLLFRCWHNWIRRCGIVINLLINATILCTKTLPTEFSHLALVIFKVAETLLARKNTNMIIFPRVRKITLACPIVSVTSWHLICLRNAFSMVELFGEVDHASC